MGGQLPNLEWMPHQASNKKRWAANHWFPRSSNYVRDDEWPKNLVGGQSQVSILRGATGSRIRMKYGWQPSPSNSGEVDRNWKNLGREDGIGTKMPPAETKIKQTMLHPRSKTHYKNQMSCSASNAKQGSSFQGQNREELSLRCRKSTIVSAGVNTWFARKDGAVMGPTLFTCMHVPCDFTCSYESESVDVWLHPCRNTHVLLCDMSVCIYT